MKGVKTHGLPGTYTKGCRCTLCRNGWRTYANARRAKERAS